MNNDELSLLVPPDLQPGEFYVIDAPGIGGSGPPSRERLMRHIKAGGKTIHKMRPDGNGTPQPVDPAGMWPELYMKNKQKR